MQKYLNCRRENHLYKLSGCADPENAEVVFAGSFRDGRWRGAADLINAGWVGGASFLAVPWQQPLAAIFAATRSRSPPTRPSPLWTKMMTTLICADE